ncbi:type IVB secretion system protein IcmC/DotE [soil metagenome]
MMLIRYRICVLIVIAASLLTLTGCSSHPVDMEEMLINLSGSLSGLWHMITAFAYVMGFLFTFKAVYYLKVYGESRTMMASQSNLKVPLSYMLAAAAFIYTPTMFHVLMVSSFGYESPIKYDTQTTQGLSSTSMDAIIYLVQTVGLIAFLRGWFHLAKNSEQGAQANNGKAFAHIIGGLLAINIMGTKEMLWNTFGFGA